ARKIVDLRGGGQLSPRFHPGVHNRFQIGPGSIDCRSIARWSRSYDQCFYSFHLLCHAMILPYVDYLTKVGLLTKTLHFGIFWVIPKMSTLRAVRHNSWALLEYFSLRSMVSIKTLAISSPVVFSMPSSPGEELTSKSKGPRLERMMSTPATSKLRTLADLMANFRSSGLIFTREA